MNNHMSGCRYGTNSHLFDQHVFKCGNLATVAARDLAKYEPFFKFHIMMVCGDYNRLLDYEKKFHRNGMDTLNNNDNNNS